MLYFIAEFCLLGFLIRKIINADHLKTNCQMKGPQSGATSGFADTMQFKQLFPELNYNAGEWECYSSNMSKCFLTKIPL